MSNFLSGDTREPLSSILKSLVIDKEPTIKSNPRIEILGKESTSTQSTSDQNSIKQNEKSLLEVMMEEGLVAKVHQDEKRALQRSEQVHFASYGLKKGFLNRTKEKTKKKKAMKFDIIVAPSTEKSINANPLEIAEVQKAMSQTSLFRKTIENVFESKDLLYRIQQNRILMIGMSDPECMAALDAFQRNPEEAVDKYRHHPKLNEFMNELFSILGDHFIRMDGNSADSDKSDKKESHVLQGKDRDGKCCSTVNDILKDRELMLILLDAEIQRIMQECSLSYKHTMKYLSNPSYGPKLQRLIDAGLLRWE